MYQGLDIQIMLSRGVARNLIWVGINVN